MRKTYAQDRRGGRFFGRRVNCEGVPALPAIAVRRVLDDPRKIPYLLVWRSSRDGLIKEAVRIIRLGSPPYLPEAASIKVKRTDGSVCHLRVLKRPLPRNAGYDVLLSCPHCCSLRRALYGWEAGGPYTNSAETSSWKCRGCAGLRYSSEGGALIHRSRWAFARLIEQQFGPSCSPRPEPWLPYVFTSPEEAAEAGICELSSSVGMGSGDESKHKENSPQNSSGDYPEQGGNVPC
jgi:hypothetical protein